MLVCRGTRKTSRLLPLPTTKPTSLCQTAVPYWMLYAFFVIWATQPLYLYIDLWTQPAPILIWSSCFWEHRFRQWRGFYDKGGLSWGGWPRGSVGHSFVLTTAGLVSSLVSLVNSVGQLTLCKHSTCHCRRRRMTSACDVTRWRQRVTVIVTSSAASSRDSSAA